jgi:hypothetical protein
VLAGEDVNGGTLAFLCAGAASLALGVAGCAETVGTSPDLACYGLAAVFLLSGLVLGRRFS